MLGLVGRKIGMTRVFSDDGVSIPVTVVSVSGNRVVQHKTKDRDGYCALQVAFGDRRASRVSRALAGHCAKAGVVAGSVLMEFPVPEGELSSFPLGDTVFAGRVFDPGDKVDVTGVTKGRGFSGVIRRHNFSSNRASHGNSRSHNTPGSISMAQDPGRVFPGKRMAGHYGAERRTVQGLAVIRIDEARQLLLIRGSVPGADSSLLVVRPTVKG
jgi:large subunit ribosomal protein L3